MDGRTIWTLGMTAVVAGLPMVVLFGVMWWLALRRVGLGERLVSTAGVLQAFDVERKKGAKGAVYFVIRCRYEYTVGGKAYAGTRAALEFNSYNSEAQARAKIGTARIGDQVTVWYDPAAPETAVIEKSPPGGLWIYKWLTIGILALAVIGGIAALLTMGST